MSFIRAKESPAHGEAGWLPEMIPACCPWFLAGAPHDSHAIHSPKGVAATVLALHHCAIANVDWFPSAADMSPHGVARTGLHQLLSRSLCPCGYLRAALSDHLLARLRILSCCRLLCPALLVRYAGQQQQTLYRGASGRERAPITSTFSTADPVYRNRIGQ